MKIVHVCLAAAYVEGFGYQENILTEFHAREGHKVYVLTSEYEFDKNYKKIVREKMEYVNAKGIHVKALTQKNILRKPIYGKFNNVLAELEKVEPDIIFVHGGQFLSLKDIVRYCRSHDKVRLYIDQHGDYYNTPVNTLKKRFSQKIIYGYWMRKAVKYCNVFWGVTPWRCTYLNDVYGIPKEKINLLVMGGDDRYIHFNKKPLLRDKIRHQLNLKKNDFVAITGGKIDQSKNIHLLMKAIVDLKQDDLKLIVFGQASESMKMVIQELSQDEHIRNIGWINSSEVYDYFLASDLAVFPGTHSVLWEQACACGLPAIFKNWEGMHHVDLGGNCEFLTKDDVEEIKIKVKEIYENHYKYENMKSIAEKYCIPTFSYSNIAKRSIEEHETK